MAILELLDHGGWIIDYEGLVITIAKLSVTSLHYSYKWSYYYEKKRERGRRLLRPLKWIFAHAKTTFGSVFDNG
jgi:hypothetical protein